MEGEAGEEEECNDKTEIGEEGGAVVEEEGR